VKGNVNNKLDAVIINEVQLILAEKRTSLATMRTGLAVLTLPLSVVSVLIVTSRYYDVLHVMPLLIPVVLVCTALTVLGSYLVARAVVRIRHYDQLIAGIKRKYSEIAQFID
jgi:hypothetical protein